MGYVAAYLIGSMVDETNLLIMDSEALPVRVSSMNEFSQRLICDAGGDAISGADEAGQLSTAAIVDANKVLADTVQKSIKDVTFGVDIDDIVTVSRKLLKL